MPAQRLAKRSSKRTQVDFQAYESGKTPTKIPPNQLRFVEEYMVDLNGAAAAIRAGYSARSAGDLAYQLLEKPLVKAEIEKRQKKLSDKLQISHERVALELARLGFSNMGRYIEFTKDGDPYFVLNKLGEEEFAAVGELIVEDYKDGRGKDARDVKKIKLKLVDKKGPLELLGKHLGMFKDSLIVTGPDGGPVQMQAVRRILVEEGKMRDITPKKKKE